ncbi:MAG: 50S ribosomal protein L6 [Candidatus Nealsonbacteria bacterium RIFCSPHIGHO2_01_FULL_43_31]|uniref:Large ribosomal subunit protein uL6 n=2 Tax=Candidatus Nealsoniibacteriota TaxID=1817911 RepID=A0A1G2E7N4_9BACT|nr:MAG: 50S ribosomal protein L6 [Parcubacteria group bacterium GW2011_GWB1_43_6]OGZ19765.1 MAG: 50S ribosomal protein L6 [Candidatus Nealsonbacteria bacterium RIFCSPHIGHO2_01_FULL_43_31]OGZ21271.1 MAG: 50S ribosomal protein L6 [Candidatus Nealsonbacteria bacterium RIFCSPHIGHO2_02_FULL_43_13]OGZ24561.1 MAG: 50S ribosomal protein L6 [Candidatus Nealsonbacteria bacterium RIFCSPLOWO2_01_FULL_43_36]
MSRIGKKPIEILAGVEVKILGQQVSVKGPKGELFLKVRPEIKVEMKDGKILVFTENEEARAFWGLTRALLANMVQGVVKNFEKKLEIVGVGNKAVMEGQTLVLSVGFSHPVKVPAPQGIAFSAEKNIITVQGTDRGLVGQTAANIRKIRPPEPYKGKGIRYFGEQIKLKEGKRAATTTAGA